VLTKIKAFMGRPKTKEMVVKRKQGKL
jgi:hypothetical protein